MDDELEAAKELGISEEMLESYKYHAGLDYTVLQEDMLRRREMALDALKKVQARMKTIRNRRSLVRRYKK